MTNGDTSLQLSSPAGNIKCHKCGTAMKQISWKVTAGAHDAGKEVEQFVFECDNDKNTACIELTTGKPSEFAVDVDISITKL